MFNFKESKVIGFRVFTEDDSSGPLMMLGEDFMNVKDIPVMIREMKKSGVRVDRVDLITKVGGKLDKVSIGPMGVENN